MMPETSFPKLNDETFPASLLLDFDELDDDIPISPPRILEPANTNSAPGSRSPVTTSQTSNSSSGNYSLSTENENGSNSSNSSNLFVKYRPLSSKRSSTAHNSIMRNGAKTSGMNLPSSNSQKRAKSEENLLSSEITFTKTGVVSKAQKYGHVKSKVKQYIDETLNQHTRHPLVRHKSMPEPVIENKLEQKEEIPLEHDANTLRAMLKETSDEVTNLQRHLEFSEMLRKDDIAKIELLKRKIEAMRLEHSMREKERQRERESEKELDRKLVLANYFRYSSQNSLNRVFASVGTQTSPEAHTATLSNSFIFSDESMDRGLASNFASTSGTSSPLRTKRALTFVADSQPESGEIANVENLSPGTTTHPSSSPDYPRLCPTAVVYNQPPQDNSGEITELLIQNKLDSCRECGRKNKKTKSKKTRLASFFCIKKVD